MADRDPRSRRPRTDLSERAWAELAGVVAGSAGARRAETAAAVRFGGRVRIAAGRVVGVEAAVASGRIAQRLRKDIADLYGHTATVQVPADRGDQPAQPRYVVQVAAGADRLARQTGMLDPRARPVAGLPAWIVAGPPEAAAAAWRGAFAARGSLSAPPGRRPVLQVACPGPEAGMALVGLARRLGITATTTETPTGYRVTVRNAEAIADLLAQMGAHATRLAFEQAIAPPRRPRSGRRGATTVNQANRDRTVTAAAAATARVQHALTILGDTAPAQLAEAGRLRVEHPEASLQQLGRCADPPLTKDAINGRIRRLVAMADRQAHHDGRSEAGPDAGATATEVAI